MPGSTLETVKQIFRPWYLGLGTPAVFIGGLYQFACDQFGAPTIPRLWGMTGAYLPWWGWMLIVQALITVAVFNYVRRQLPFCELGRGGELAVLAIKVEQLEARPVVNEERDQQTPSDIAELRAKLSALTDVPAKVVRLEALVAQS